MTFKNYLLEKEDQSGQSAGKLELVKTDVKTARAYGEKVEKENGRDLDTEIPNFDKNYLKAQKITNKHGKTKRKEMPVVQDFQVKEMQERLKKGYIDINNPLSDQTKKRGNPFPEGLTGKDANHFLEAGLKKYDGDANDDKVKVSLKKIKIGDLIPIQQQIYFDKSMDGTAQFGRKGTKDFLESSNFIASSDLAIIDGHHRYLSGYLLDPNLKVPVLIIDMPINKLLPMSKAYGDALGNKRNQ